MSTSLRRRVLLGATLVTFVALLVASGIGNVMLRDGLIRQLDERLALAAHGLTPAFRDDGESVRFEWGGAEVGPQVLFRAWDASGSITCRIEWQVINAKERCIKAISIPKCNRDTEAERRVQC